MAIPKPDQPEITEPKTENTGKFIIFTCNWQAYHGLETACRDRQAFPPNVYPLRVMCLGQLSPGIILKALEKGAEGILLLGCQPGECHFEFGMRRAEEVYLQVKQLASLLGYRDEQIRLDWVPGGGGDRFIEKICDFTNAVSAEVTT